MYTPPPPHSRTTSSDDVIELLHQANAKIKQAQVKSLRHMGKPFGRDLAWQHCFDYFRKSQKDLVIPTPLVEKLDEAATHLSCYLAYFGMYRGSSTLLQTNRTILIPAIRESWVCAAKFPDFLCTTNPSCVTLIRKTIRKELSNSFSLLVSKSSPYISDILVSKMMLGMFACNLAYDVNVQRGLNYFQEIGLKSSFSSNIGPWNTFSCVPEVLSFFKERQKEYYIEKEYVPFNRIADIFFFNLGLALSSSN